MMTSLIMCIINDILANNALFSNKDISIRAALKKTIFGTHIAGYPLHILSETEFSKSYPIRIKLAFKLKNILKLLISRK